MQSTPHGPEGDPSEEEKGMVVDTSRPVTISDTAEPVAPVAPAKDS